MLDSTVLTDEEFGKLDYDKLMETFDRQVNNQPVQEEQSQPQEVQQQEQSLAEQANFGDNSSNQETTQNYNNPEQDTTTSYQDGSNEVDPSIYKETYDRITAPFKASGREFQVRNVDEAISLMQKGVDYTKKQQALKPRLVEMRTLEEQGMLGNNLNFAIDLFRGNPQALSKLIKERGIDIKQLLPQVDDYGNEQKPAIDPSTYTPNNYTISPEKLRFQEVVDTLNETGMYSKVDTALDDFDSESKATFANNPNYYLVLSDLIQKGHYEPIKNELEHLRIVGDPAIEGKNYMDAFSVVANRYFNSLNTQQGQQPNTYQQQQPNQQAFQQQRQYQQVQQRKQGASPVRSSPNRAVTQYDPLKCSDEEFAKIDINELMRR